MKTNHGPIILAQRAVDQVRIRTVLHEWGYRESEIQRFLREPRLDQKLESRRKTDDQSGKITHSVS